jgi:mRNA interferase MazF
LSPEEYNCRTGIFVCCPISTKVKGYQFEVAISSNGIVGVVQADQIRTLDWITRQIKYHGVINSETLLQVQARIVALITK